jgi:galactitol-specific phosphotransferase system IIB component
MNNISIVVCSSKGGVGTSFVAKEIITTYLYNKYRKKIMYYKVEQLEIEDNSLLNSDILNINNLKNINDDNLLEIFSHDEPVVFDVGSNKSTEKAILELAYVNMSNLFYIITFNMNEESIKHAKITYDYIKEKSANAKIILALNNVTSSDENYIVDKINLIQENLVFSDEKKEKHIIIPHFGNVDKKTIWEKSLFLEEHKLKIDKIFEELDKFITTN